VKRHGLVKKVTRQLAQLRRELGVTQEELAERLDIPVQHVSRIEAGQNITLLTLERVATALGVVTAVRFESDARGPQTPPPTRRQRMRRE